MTKFEREIYHNRDKKYKISLLNHIQYIFDLYGMEETALQVIPTEYIDNEFSNKILDFAVECKSGNIYDIECESLEVNEKTGDKTWKYVKELYSRYDNDIYSVIIALAENNEHPIKKIGTTTHKPIIWEMKKFNGDEYLNSIRKKFNDNEELTSHYCAIIETIPDMKNTGKTDTIVEELCYIIKNGNININNRITLQSTMWLNIDYYVKNREKRKKLMEMIDVKNSLESEYEKWKKEYENKGEEKGKKEGRIEGRREKEKEIIYNLLNYMKPKEIAKTTGISLKEINKITGK